MNKAGIDSLSTATYAGNLQIAKALLETGEIPSSSSRKSLIIATRRDDHIIVQLLLGKANTDIRSKDEVGKTALHVAVRSKQISMIKLLLASDATDLDSKDEQENTSLLMQHQKGILK